MYELLAEAPPEASTWAPYVQIFLSGVVIPLGYAVWRWFSKKWTEFTESMEKQAKAIRLQGRSIRRLKKATALLKENEGLDRKKLDDCQQSAAAAFTQSAKVKDQVDKMDKTVGGLGETVGELGQTVKGLRVSVDSLSTHLQNGRHEPDKGKG